MKVITAPCCDLDWKGEPGNSEVVVGKETARNLERLLSYHLELIRSKKPLDVRSIKVLFTTGLAPNHGRVFTGRVMSNYYQEMFFERLGFRASIYVNMASEFNTLSEMEAVADFVLKSGRDDIDVVIIVKWWHWLRTAWMSVYAHRQKGYSWSWIIRHVRTLPCQSVLGWANAHVWRLAVLDFICGTYKNIGRIRARNRNKLSDEDNQTLLQ